MIDQPNDTAPGGEPHVEEPTPDHGPAPEAEQATSSQRAKEWIAQLEAMIHDISTQAAPVARQVGAKAAELAAVAAVKAGPFAQKAAEVTTDYGQRFAEKAQSVAAELRSPHAPAPESAPAAPAAETAPKAEPVADEGAGI